MWEFVSSRWGELVTIILLLAPIILHISEKAFETTKILGQEAIKTHLKGSDIKGVKTPEILSNTDLFESIDKFYRFEQTAHFVLSLILFSIISLIIINLEKAEIKNTMVFILIIAYLIFSAAFLFALLTGKYNSNRTDAIRGWRYGSYAIVALTVSIQIYLLTKAD